LTPVDRRRDRAVRAWTTVLTLVCVFGVVFAGAAAYLVIKEYRWVGLAQHMLRDGQTVTVQVAPRVDAWDQIELSLEIDGQVLHPGLVHTDMTTAEDDMSVLYVADEPDHVMTAEDADYYANEAVAGGLGAMFMCLTPALVTGIVWLVRGRPDWSQHVNERWLPSLP
jgi:hypothetical protein